MIIQFKKSTNFNIFYFYQNLEKYYNNPNVIVLIIEKMSFGIFFHLRIFIYCKCIIIS